jgi:sulfate/thiosulfate transport system permease protein
VLIPLAAVLVQASAGGWSAYWEALSSPQTLAALELTVGQAVLVTAVNIVMGTTIAWVLVRDQFAGKQLLEVVIDIPFALPTIVAGLVLLSLYGPSSPLGVNWANTPVAVFLAFLFVTLPFIVRTVQPVLLELEQEVEEAAASLGAGKATTFRRVILPSLLPAMLSGTALAFARSISEFGSTVLISGNIPFDTQVAAVSIFGQIESDNITGAAAVSTVLLVVALVMLVSLDLLQRWGSRRG